MSDNNHDALYSQIGETARTFWEWRHKVISIYFLALGGVFLLASWMYEHELRQCLFLPFFLGAAISVILACMDSINTKVLTHCYTAGANFEEILDPTRKGIFTLLHTGYSNRWTYGKLLRITYVGTAIISFVFGAWLLVSPIK